MESGLILTVNLAPAYNYAKNKENALCVRKTIISKMAVKEWLKNPPIGDKMSDKFFQSLPAKVRLSHHLKNFNEGFGYSYEMLWKSKLEVRELFSSLEIWYLKYHYSLDGNDLSQGYIITTENKIFAIEVTW